ncbi:MAG: hypothetical protein ACTSUE_07185 [Promethearchaeota archaeon]
MAQHGTGTSWKEPSPHNREKITTQDLATEDKSARNEIQHHPPANPTTIKAIANHTPIHNRIKPSIKQVTKINPFSGGTRRMKGDPRIELGRVIL